MRYTLVFNEFRRNMLVFFLRIVVFSFILNVCWKDKHNWTILLFLYTIIFFIKTQRHLNDFFSTCVLIFLMMLKKQTELYEWFPLY